MWRRILWWWHLIWLWCRKIAFIYMPPLQRSLFVYIFLCNAYISFKTNQKVAKHPPQWHDVQTPGLKYVHLSFNVTPRCQMVIWTKTILNGFQYEIAQLFSLMSRSVMWYISYFRSKVKLTLKVNINFIVDLFYYKNITQNLKIDFKLISHH